MQDDYPPRGYAWTVVAILIATAILSYTDRQVLSLLVDPIRADLGISDTQVSFLLGTAFAVVYGVAGIPLGYLADRTSRRNLILTGVLVWSLGTVGCGLARHYGELFAGRLVVGLGEAVLSPAAISLISDYFPPARRGMAVGCFLSGIAMGIGTAILIGGSVLHLVQLGVLENTPLSQWPAWRLVLLLIGAPGFLWLAVLLFIKEPVRRAEASRGRRTPGVGSSPNEADSAGGEVAPIRWGWVIPIYSVVAIASLVDNAVGGWAPTLLTRDFQMDRARAGVELGMWLTAAFGGGVLLGGWLADRAGASGGIRGKLFVCLASSVLIVPVGAALAASRLDMVFPAIPAYFFLSGIVTACGFSAILDGVPNRSRGLAMAISFFLNVAVGGAVGPTAVSLVGAKVFGPAAGLGLPLAVTASVSYGIAIAALLVATIRMRSPSSPS